MHPSRVNAELRRRKNVKYDVVVVAVKLTFNMSFNTVMLVSIAAILEARGFFSEMDPQSLRKMVGSAHEDIYIFFLY